MNILMRLLLFVLLAPNLKAETVFLRGIEASYEVGRNQLAGSLSDQNVAPSHGLHMLVWAPVPESDFSLLGFFDLSLIQLGDPQAKASDFPFTSDEKITITRSAISPTVCVRGPSVTPCLGLGYALYDFEQSHSNEQTYGGFLYTLWLRHHLANGLSASLKTDWGEVAMRVQGNDSFVELWSSSLVIGYRF